MSSFQLKTDLDALQSHLRPYCQNCGLEVDWRAVRSMELESTVDFFYMNPPMEQSEKQALLEAETIDQSAKLLIGFADTVLVADGAGHEVQH